MSAVLRMTRLVSVVAVAGLVAACSTPATLDEPIEPMGNFLLGHNIVVVKDPEIGPFSRTATDEEWQKSLTDAIAARFGRYDGDKYYHIGIKIDAYALGMAGVPLVFKPQSVLAITVNIWDDSTQKRLNAEPKHLTIFEGLSGESIVGSGLTQSKAQQMQRLSTNAAKAVQEWILQNPEWVGLPPLDTPAAAADDAPVEPAVTEPAN